MHKDHERLMKELRDEADLCRNEGIEGLANLLDKTADRIEYFMRLENDLRAECMSNAIGATK